MSLSKLNKCMPSYDFPEEVLSEVFKRLPVKYVLRCGAVQKSWYRLIKTPFFISLHCNYQKMTAQNNPKYLLFHNTKNQELTVRSDDAQSQEYCTFYYPPDLPVNAWYTQSNGLVCVSAMFDYRYEYNPDIYLWNPLVQKYRTVPDTPLPRFEYKKTWWIALAFGFLPEVNDYVVVHMAKIRSTPALDLPNDSYKQYPHTVVIGVYSLNTNSWKKICQDKVFVDEITTNEPVFVNGNAFWVGYNRDEKYQLVMFFDTKTNILRQIKVPPWVDRHARQLVRPLILPFGQSIAYFVEGEADDWHDWDQWDGIESHTPHLDIWVLKENMIKDLSWEKKMSVRLDENVRAKVLGTRNNGEPIQAKSNSLISYDLDTREPYVFVKSCDRLTPCYIYEEGSELPFIIHPFAETLILLDISEIIKPNVQSEYFSSELERLKSEWNWLDSQLDQILSNSLCESNMLKFNSISSPGQCLHTKSDSGP